MSKPVETRPAVVDPARVHHLPSGEWETWGLRGKPGNAVRQPATPKCATESTDRQPGSQPVVNQGSTRETPDVKPLFIPLKREYFEAFERGQKLEEFRPLGPRWNGVTCRIGRPVVLSLGYGKARRLHGRVRSFRKEFSPHATLPGWSACYPMSCAPAACIGVEILPAE